MRTNPVLEVLLKSRGSISKLGPDVYSWSLPPGITCPGQSNICRKICYAKGICGRYPPVDPAWKRNLKLADRKDFPSLLTQALEAILERELHSRSTHALPGIPLRIHVGGDFYRPSYIEAWLGAVSEANAWEPRFPILPWAYTRAWRVPWLCTAITEYATRMMLPIWPEWLWCSTDPSTETVNTWVNEARMVPYPVDRSASSRTQWRRELAKNQLTCPHLAEKFRGNPNPPTCQQCGRCWDPKKIAPRRLGLGQTLLIPQHR